MLEGLAVIVKAIEAGKLPHLEVVLLLSGLVVKGTIYSNAELEQTLKNRLLETESPGDAAVVQENTSNTVSQITGDYLENRQDTSAGDDSFFLIEAQVITPQGTISLPHQLIVSYEAVLAYSF